jgi:hypothetical protein
MQGLTISEMAQILGIKENAVKRRLFTHKIIPFISRVALYTHDDLEAIKTMSKRGPRVETPSPGALYAREYRARKKAAAASGQAFADKRRKEGGEGGAPAMFYDD